MSGRLLSPTVPVEAPVAPDRADRCPTVGSAIVRPSLAFAAVDVAGKVLGLAVVIVLARRLTDGQFGRVVASLACANVLLAFFDFGMNLHLVALVVQDRRQVRDAIARRYQALGVILLAALAAGLLQPLRAVAVCVAAGAAMAAVPTGVLLAGGERFWAGCALVGPNILFLGLLAGVPDYDAPRAMMLWTIANVVVLVCLWLRVQWLRPKRRPRVGLWSLHRQSLSLALFNVVVLAYGRLDTVLVAVLVSSAAAGVYGTYYRVVLAAVSVASWSANIAARRLGDAERGMDELRRLLRYTATLALIVSGALLLCLDPAVHVLLGRRVSLPIGALVALAALPLPLMVANPITFFVVISGHQRRLTAASVVVGALALVLYPVIIAAYGMTGGALTSLAVEVLALFLFARVVVGCEDRDAGVPR